MSGVKGEMGDWLKVLSKKGKGWLEVEGGKVNGGMGNIKVGLERDRVLWGMGGMKMGMEKGGFKLRGEKVGD